MGGEREAAELIREVERRREAALLSVDLDALDALFAEDLVHIHSTGLVHGKAELLEHIGRRRAFIAIERGPLDVRIEGNTAVMTGRQTSRMRSPSGSEVVMDGFVTQILRRSNEGWKLINFQLTLNREGLTKEN
jgi:ketosteroid isomerase-like protein